MGWQSADPEQLPVVSGQTYSKNDVILDGNSFQNCRFNECLIYRGGPTRVFQCYISANTEFMFTDAAAYVLQTLQELGWTIAPPGHIAQIKR
jgi:hypothetical protein